MPVPVTRLDGGTASSPAQVPEPQAPVAPAPLPISQIDDASRTPLDGAATVSLSIAHPMPLRDMLRLLVAGTALSIVFDDGVDGAFEGDLRGLTMRQALEAVLFPRALDYDVRGSLVRVFPRRVETRLFDVNYVNVRRTWQRTVRSATGVPGGGDDTRAVAVGESDALGELERGVRALLSDGGRMHLDRHAGLVQVTDFADRLDRVALYVEAAEGRASRQVRIEARIFEVTLNPSVSTLDWRAALARAGPAARREPASAGIRVTDFAALMHAIAEQGTVRTIAAPTVTAMHNEPAVMRIGTQEVYFVAASQVDASGRVTDRPHAPASVLAGLTLTVTPQVATDGIVRLHMAPTYAQKTRDAASSGDDVVPVLRVTESDTSVRVQDGETVVIAGLLQDRDRIVPAVGFAGFFGAQARETVTSELVILLTPTIVSPAPRAPAGSR
jgi:MSHA biogenesis protein MshL